MKRYILVLVMLIVVLTINVSIPVNATSVPITIPIPVDVTNQLIELANQLGIDTSELTLANLKTFVTENENMQKFLEYFKIVQATFDVMALQGNPLILDDIAKDLANNNYTNEENVIAVAYDQFENGNSGAIRYIKNSATVNSIEYQFHAWYRTNFKYENGNYIITTKNYAYDGSVYYMDNICPNFNDTFKYVPSEFLDVYIQMQDDLRALTFQTVGAVTLNNVQSGETITGFFKDYPHVIETASNYADKFLLRRVSDTQAELHYSYYDYQEMKLDESGYLTTDIDCAVYRRYLYFDTISVSTVGAQSIDAHLVFQYQLVPNDLYTNFNFYNYDDTLIYIFDESTAIMPTSIVIPDVHIINLSDGSVAVDEDDAVDADDVEVDVEEDENGIHTGIYVPGISEGLSIAFGDGIEADFSQIQDSFINKLGTSKLAKAWEKFNSLQQSNEPPKITINLNALFNTASNFTGMTDAFGPEGDEFVLIDFATLEDYEFMGMTLIAFIRMVIGTTMIITTVLSLKNAIHPSKAVAS